MHFIIFYAVIAAKCIYFDVYSGKHCIIYLGPAQQHNHGPYQCGRPRGITKLLTTEKCTEICIGLHTLDQSVQPKLLCTLKFTHQPFKLKKQTKK